MLNGSLAPKIYTFAATVLITNIIQLMFHTADLVVVGKFAGNDALGAVGATSALSAMFVTFFSGFSVGISVNCSHSYGAGDTEGFKKTVSTAFTLALFAGFILCGLGFFTSGKILELMNTTEKYLPMSTLYMKIYFLCMPAQMMFTYMAAVIKSLGNTRTPMVYLLISGAINVLLNLFFVCYMKMTVDGVAIATVISQYVSAALIILHMVRSNLPYNLSRVKIGFELGITKKILTVGVPIGLHGLIISFANIFIQKNLNSFDPYTMAGVAAAGNIENYIYFFQAGLSEASVNFIGQNYGAHKFDRVKRTIAICFISAVVVGIVTGVGSYLIGEPLLNLFLASGEGHDIALKAGMVKTLYVCGFYVLYGMCNSTTGILSGFGKTFASTIVTVVGFCGVRLLWLATYFPRHSESLHALFICYPLSWAVSFVALAIVYLFTIGKVLPKKKHGDRHISEEEMDRIKYL